MKIVCNKKNKFYSFGPIIVLISIFYIITRIWNQIDLYNLKYNEYENSLK